MNVMLLPKKCFDVLVYTVYYQPPQDGAPSDSDLISICINNIDYSFSPTGLGQILVNQNYAAYNFHSGRRDKPFAYSYEFHPDFEHATAVEKLKLCDCYVGQIYPLKDYMQSKAVHIINFIRELIIADLPGYQDAPWPLYDVKPYYEIGRALATAT